MVKPYRIKHKASGYFYQRYNGSNLGKSGKVYMNNQSPLTMCDNEKFIRIQIRHNTLAYKVLRDMLSKYVIGKDDEYSKAVSTIGKKCLSYLRNAKKEVQDENKASQEDLEKPE